jgi:hypothetical protein
MRTNDRGPYNRHLCAEKIETFTVPYVELIYAKDAQKSIYTYAGHLYGKCVEQFYYFQCLDSIRTKVANDRSQIKITHNHKLNTFDIEDLYVNVPVKGILFITEYRFNFNNTN